MKRSKFSLSHYNLTTMDMGKLIPIGWYEALPGDTIQQATRALVRVSPLLSPVMHPCRVRIHHFFVPNRKLFEDWEDFITGGPDGTSTPEMPYMQFANVLEGTLMDHLGVPVGAHNLKFSALPVRAYNLIYNEYYRDQDLIDPLTVDTTAGEDTTSDYTIQKVAWEKDYFTTARPFEQKGDQVTIPLGQSADVIPDPNENSGKPSFTQPGNTPRTGLELVFKNGFTDTHWNGYDNVADASAYWHQPALMADLSSATGISVNDLRLALSIQRYQEARAQYGSRYVEYLRYLGVRSSDARLQNPEYLGGGRQVIQFSEVLQTAEGTDPVGEMRGHGIAAMKTNKYRRFFEEHGIVMTLMSVVPKTIYTSALHRKWSRTIKEDYFQKELQFIGEQEIPNKEIYANHSSPEGVFGYQSRYDEYRTHPSKVSGEFLDTLNYWHLGRSFSGDVALNQSFVESTPTKRVLASQSTDALYVMANHSIQARRIVAGNPKPKTF